MAHADGLRLAATRVAWVDEWLPGFHDFHVSVSIDGKEYMGRGMAGEEPLAFSKAVAEALERAAVAPLSEPWGTAAHLDFEAAARGAYRELLGIDRALCHHFCGVRYGAVPLDSLDSRLPLSALRKALRRHSLSLRVCELRPAVDARVCAAFVWSEDPRCEVSGFVDGFGCEGTLEDAAAHAVLECLRSAAAVFVGKVQPTEEDCEEDPGNPRWHFVAALQARSKAFLQEDLLPDGAGGAVLAAEAVSSADVPCERLDTLAGFLPDCPVVIAQARSERLLRPRFGRFEPDGLMRKRLERFAGGLLPPSPPVPHFYG